MKWSIDELSDIRVVVGRLLDEIGLAAYLFNIEQDEHDWIITVDYSHEGKWRTTDLRVARSVLRDCLERPESRRRLRSAWKSELDLTDR